MHRSNRVKILAALLGSALVWGCGSDSGEGLAPVQPDVPPAPVTAFVADYEDSRHASSVRGAASALCSRCHSDEGYRETVEQTLNLDAADFADFFAGQPAPAVASPIQCRTCHDTQTFDLRAQETQVVEGAEQVVLYSREFNLCTSCHQVFLAATFDGLSGTFSYEIDNARVTYVANGHPTPTALIEDTHFANPAAVTPIAGYNINAAAKNACTQCHDPHGATKFAQVDAQAFAEEWAVSGHADYQGEAFASNITSAVCFKCHSGPQFARFVRGTPAAGLDPSGGPQVVACIACHDLTARDQADNFALGALRPVDEVTFPSGAVVSLGPESNLCMECHQGRSSTPTVDARIAAGNLSFSNIHYYAAAATMFGSEVQGGYEYPGRTYAGRNTFLIHTLVGVPELTTCTGCHMGDQAEHTFAVPLDRCTSCHAGASFPELDVQPRFNFERINALKNQLLEVLEASGVTRVLDGEGNHIFPYFENINTASQLKAAYNWQVADKEPCGYIHNGFYIRQLLFDSIVDMGATPVFPAP